MTASAEADAVTLTLAYIPFFVSNIGSGSVTRSPETNVYVLGQQVTLTATPRNPNWTAFLRWSDGTNSATRTITVGTSNVFTAIFTNFVALEELVFQQWEKTYGGNADDICTTVRRTTDGGFILGGYSSSGISGSKTNAPVGSSGRDCWIIKTDSVGEKQWERAFGGTGDESVSDIVLTSDGGYLLVCATSSGASGNKTNSLFGVEDFWLIKLARG